MSGPLEGFTGGTVGRTVHSPQAIPRMGERVDCSGPVRVIYTAGDWTQDAAEEHKRIPLVRAYAEPQKKAHVWLMRKPQTVTPPPSKRRAVKAKAPKPAKVRAARPDTFPYERVRELRLMGLSDRAIAKLVGLSQACVSKRMLGEPRTVPGKHSPSAKSRESAYGHLVPEIAKLRDEGVSWRAIGKRLNVPAESIRWMWRRRRSAEVMD